MRITSRTSDETGVALVTALLATLLAAGLMAGMFAALTADQKSHSVDRDQSQAYAAAHAGLEKMTSGLAQLFAIDFSPSKAQLDVVAATPPTITGFEYTSPDGESGYVVSYTPDANGNPTANPNADITTGPFIGFKGLITPYTLTVTARSGAGSEVRLRREVQTVAVPVFQFGIFGEKSLSFHAGANFDFGGRVHTNEHLFLASGGPAAILTFRDKLTAIGEVVRRVLENTNAIENSNHDGIVRVPTVIGSASRDLAKTEGSVTTGLGSAFVNGWKNLSEVTYSTNIRNYKTGAKRLDLPLVSQGAVPIDLIRRPAINSNEDVANVPVYGQRYFAQASLRILLSDRVADLTPPALPGVTATAPIALDGTGAWAPAAGMPPLARSAGPLPSTVTISSTGGTGSNGTGTITLSSMPNWLKMGGVANISMTFGTVTVSDCTGMTATTLTGCDTTGTTPTHTNAQAPVTLDAAIGGGTVAMRTGATASSPAGASTTNNRTVTVTTTRNLAMGTRLIWAGNTPLTCTGYTTTQLTGCYWTTAPTGTISSHARTPLGTPLLGGFIKIEKQDATGVWSDVTEEILNLGFSAPNQEGTTPACDDPTPNAVLRLQRLRDSGPTGVACAYSTSATPTLFATDYWPNALYDGREGSPRNLAAADPIRMGGIMNYISLDVGNLNKWLTGVTGTTGTTTLNNNGYIVYFSDRRGNHDDTVVGAPETGEYGFEDSINPSTAAGTVNNTLDGGEDRNEDTVRQNYGWQPSTVGFPAGSQAPFDSNTTAWTTISLANAPVARVNRQVLFRRALKLVNGSIANLPVSGLTVAAENPIYVQGDYNATAASVTGASRPAAIIADTITILSNAWLDTRSFNNDINSATSPRAATTTGYRFAMIAGKSIAFAKPAWTTVGDMGTDGGVHNFMRMLENWSGQTIRYRGSMVSLYTARQGTGIYRAANDVYAPGTRDFSFDTNFLTPTLLPPGTPMFRDINTLKFRQILRPNQ